MDSRAIHHRSCILYGYGDHMFNRVPVVINTFNVELRPGIDYISTKQTQLQDTGLAGLIQIAVAVGGITDVGTNAVKHISASDTDLQQGFDQELLDEEIRERRT